MDKDMAREKVVLRYSQALAQGDFEVIGQIWHVAESDPQLENMLVEVEQIYQHEGDFVPTDARASVQALLVDAPNPAQTSRNGFHSPLFDAPLSPNSGPASSVSVTPKNSKGDEVMHDIQDKPQDAANQPILLPNPTELPDNPRRPRRYFGWLALAAAIVLAAGIGFFVWLVNSAGGNNPNLGNNGTPSPVATTPPSNRLVLTYPNAVPLKWDESAIFPNGKSSEYDGIEFAAFASNDDYKKVGDSLQQQLKAAGYKIENAAPQVCGQSSGGEQFCNETLRVRATKGNVMAFAVAYSPKAWQSNDGGSQQFVTGLRSQLKPEQTLVYYAYGVFQSPSYVPPTAAPAGPPTPVSADTPVFYGPDGRFYVKSAPGLISKAATEAAKVRGNEATLQINWLISNERGVRLGLTYKYPNTGSSPAIFGGGSGKVATLTDQKGHTYDVTSGGGSSGSPGATYFTLSGPKLPDDVTKLSFMPGPGLSISLDKPLSVDITSFKDSNYPKAVAIPGAVADVKGIKLSVPFAYFGKDKTILAIWQDISALTKNGSQNINALNLSLFNQPGVTITDDQGRTVEVKRPIVDSDNPRWDGGVSGGNFTEIYQELQPVAADARSLTLKVADFELSRFLKSATVPPPTAASGGSVPVSGLIAVNIEVAELLKNGPTKPEGQVRVNGYALDITELSATQDAAKGQVTIKIKYLPDGKPAPDGSILKSVSFQPAGNVQVSGSSSSARLAAPGAPPSERETSISFKYDGSNPYITLEITNLSYSITGPWELNIPINR